MAADPWVMVPGPGGELAVHVASAARPGRQTVLVLPGLPSEPGAARRTGVTFPDLADQLAAHLGWRVVTGCLRGVGRSPGSFSVAAWQEDLAALLRWAGGSGPIWVVGFGLAGSLALCLAAEDPAVAGVATFGAPADLEACLADPLGALQRAERLGLLEGGVPPDPEAWVAPAGALAVEAAVARLAPRPVLVVHGLDDQLVPVQHARRLAAAGGEGLELRLLAGAGHRLRADPRAVALLIGWLERQGA